MMLGDWLKSAAGSFSCQPEAKENHLFLARVLRALKSIFARFLCALIGSFDSGWLLLLVRFFVDVSTFHLDSK